MIRDITIGQYYPTDSILHRLDPRLKLVTTLIYMIALFVFDGFIEYTVITVLLISVIHLSNIPFRFIIKGLKPLMMILVFSLTFKILFTSGAHMLLEWGIVRISVEGIISAVFLALRLIYLVIGSSLVTYTTTPNMLTDALESVLSPLKIFKVRVSEMAMMMTIALRFIPILVDETDKIMKAQMSRGADFENGNLVTRIKNMVPLLIPLFIAAFTRAGDLALAMEARCYQGGEGRTKMKPLKLGRFDYYAIIYIALSVITLTLFTLVN